MKAKLLLWMEFNDPTWRDDDDAAKSLATFLERLNTEHPGVGVNVVTAHSVNDKAMVRS